MQSNMLNIYSKALKGPLFKLFMLKYNSHFISFQTYLNRTNFCEFRETREFFRQYTKTNTPKLVKVIDLQN